MQELMKDLSIVIPAYNESKSIETVVKNIKSVLKESKIDAEIIVVNDGSSDSTKKVAEKIDGITLLNHPYNKGYGASLKTGILSSKRDFVMIMDADNQHNPKDILRLYEKRNEYDMVVGARTNTTSIIRSPAKLAIGLFANYLSGRKIPDINSGFRIMKRKMVLEYLHVLPNKFSFTTTITLLAADGGFSLHYVPIRMNKRKTGKSTMHPIKDTINFFLLIIRTTMIVNPLKVFIPAAIIIFLLGLAFTIYGIVVFNSFPKSSSVIIISALFTFFFGLIADQISLMRREMK